MFWAIIFFVLILVAGLSWEAWSFYCAPVIEEHEREEEKHDAA